MPHARMSSNSQYSWSSPQLLQEGVRREGSVMYAKILPTSGDCCKKNGDEDVSQSRLRHNNNNKARFTLVHLVH